MQNCISRFVQYCCPLAAVPQRYVQMTSVGGSNLAGSVRHFPYFQSSNHVSIYGRNYFVGYVSNYSEETAVHLYVFLLFRIYWVGFNEMWLWVCVYVSVFFVCLFHIYIYIYILWIWIWIVVHYPKKKSLYLIHKHLYVQNKFCFSRETCNVFSWEVYILWHMAPLHLVIGFQYIDKEL